MFQSLQIYISLTNLYNDLHSKPAFNTFQAWRRLGEIQDLILTLPRLPAKM